MLFVGLEKRKEKIMSSTSKNKAREWFDTIFYGLLIAICFRSLNISNGNTIMSCGNIHIFVEKWSYGYSRYSFPFGSWKLWNGRFFAREPKVGDVIVFRNPQDESVDFVKRLIGRAGDRIQMMNGRLYINGQMVERKKKGDYIIATFRGPSGAERGPFHTRHGDIVVRGNKIFLANGDAAPFNYTITYNCNDNSAFNGCNRNEIEELVEYTEVLPNGVEHSIIERSDNDDYDNTLEYTVPENHLFFMGDDRDFSADSRRIGSVPIENVAGRVWGIWYSHNYAAPMLFVWKWGAKMRWDRFGLGVK